VPRSQLEALIGELGGEVLPGPPPAPPPPPRPPSPPPSPPSPPPPAPPPPPRPWAVVGELAASLFGQSAAAADLFAPGSEPQSQLRGHQPGSPHSRPGPGPVRGDDRGAAADAREAAGGERGSEARRMWPAGRGRIPGQPYGYVVLLSPDRIATPEHKALSAAWGVPVVSASWLYDCVSWAGRGSGGHVGAQPCA
jgi:hypothetical protein